MPPGAKLDGQPLLDRINQELGGDPRHWMDVALVRNVGPLLDLDPTCRRQHFESRIQRDSVRADREGQRTFSR